jgi:hypothetical protein
MALRRFAGNRPVWFGIVITLAFTVLQIVAGMVAYGIQDPVTRTLVATLIRGLGAVIWLVLLARLGWLRAAGVSGRGTWRLWGLVLALMVYDVGLHMWAFFGDFDLPIEDPTLAGATALSHLIDGGLTQELVFRGLILCALVQAWGRSRRSLIKSGLVSSLIFGSVHVVNLVVVIASGAKSAAMVGMQVLSTLLAGVLYAGLVLYGGTFWPAALLHAMLNVTTNVRAIATPGFEETMAAWVTIVLGQLPLAALGLYLLWQAGARRDPVEAGRQKAVVTS